MSARRGLMGTPAALAAASLAVLMAAHEPAAAQSLPQIRTGPQNPVPACVTPPRLMRFLRERNPRVQPQFHNIAAYYKEHGERLGVRWDYAFFQMIIETNALIFKNNAGKGDVSPSQNNFAGIGTTGGGVPGDRFPDVSTGVLGQMQHLVAYSGQRVDQPVATRTREKQDDIISASRRLGRPVTFRDLAGRWAVDRRYGRSISFIADQYQSRFCNGRNVEPDPPAEREPERPPIVSAKATVREDQAGAAPRPSPVGTWVVSPPGLIRPPTLATRPKPTVCKVFTASYGGERNVLIRRRVGSEVHYTALQVLDGRERGLAEAFIVTHAQGGETIGEFANRKDALADAFTRCPQAATVAAGNG